MYRTYEDPYKLEELLSEAEERLANAIARDEDNLEDYYLDVQDLKDRINFAWQDDEYDSNYYDGDFEE